IVVGVDVVPNGDREPVTLPDRLGEMAGAVGHLPDLEAVPPAKPSELGARDVEDPEPSLSQLLELAGERIEQLVPVPVLINGQQYPTVAGHLGDHSAGPSRRKSVR